MTTSEAPDAVAFQSAAWEQLKRASGERRGAHIRHVLEAVLFASQRPLTLRELARQARVGRDVVQQALDALIVDYGDERLGGTDGLSFSVGLSISMEAEPGVGARVGCEGDKAWYCFEEDTIGESAGVLLNIELQIDPGAPLGLHAISFAEDTGARHALATRLGAWEDSESLILEIEAQLMRIEVESLQRERIRVFYPIWRNPWMSVNADTYIHSMLSRIGADNVCANYTDRYPVVHDESVKALAPDLVLLPSEPYAFGLTHQTEVLRSGLFPGKPVLLIDGRDASWHGARTGRALGRLHDFMLRQRPLIGQSK